MFYGVGLDCTKVSFVGSHFHEELDTEATFLTVRLVL